jgi:predicted branched-subunit amino acid permease
MSAPALVRTMAAGADGAAGGGRTSSRSPAAGEVRRGALTMLPMLIGYAPVAAIVGTAIAGHDEPLAAWTATGLVYGGAAQLALLATLSAGSGAVLAAAAGLVVNTRLMAYAATMTRHWHHESRRFRALAGAVLTDASWILGLARYQQPGSRYERRGYYLGAAVTLFGSWLGMVTVAALLANRLPVHLDLTVAMPLCLLAMVSSGLRNYGGSAAAGAGAVAAVTTSALPVGTGVIVAAAAGAAVGCFVDRWTRRRTAMGGRR